MPKCEWIKLEYYFYVTYKIICKCASTDDFARNIKQKYLSSSISSHQYPPPILRVKSGAMRCTRRRCTKTHQSRWQWRSMPITGRYRIKYLLSGFAWWHPVNNGSSPIHYHYWTALITRRKPGRRSSHPAFNEFIHGPYRTIRNAQARGYINPGTANAGSMLGQRLRRWPSIDPVLAGSLCYIRQHT